MKSCLTVAFLTLIFTPPGLLAGTGTIKGVVPMKKGKTTAIAVEKYRGKISGKVSPAPASIAAVWLEGPNLSSAPSSASVALPQTNYQFDKSLMIIPRGTTVTFPNNDPDYHNIYSLSRSKKFDLGRYKENENPAPSVLFDKVGFIALRCEIHKHMNANIIVVNSPYYTVTDNKGFFTLKNIPSGAYTLHAQSDRKTSWQIPVNVSAKKTISITFPNK